MKHLKLFKTKEEYEAFKESGEYLTPNVSFIETAGSVINDSYQVWGESKYGMLFFDISNVPENMTLQILSVSFLANLGHQIVPATSYAYDSQGYEENLYGIKKVAVVYGYATSDTQVTEDIIKSLFGQLNAQEITEEEFYNLGSYLTIEFTIDGTSYQAEKGMTWLDFVNSEYSNDDFYVNAYDVKYQGYVFASSTNEWQSSDSVIIANEAYHTIQAE